MRPLTNPRCAPNGFVPRLVIDPRVPLCDFLLSTSANSSGKESFPYKINKFCRVRFRSFSAVAIDKVPRKLMTMIFLFGKIRD